MGNKHSRNRSNSLPASSIASSIASSPSSTSTSRRSMKFLEMLSTTTDSELKASAIKSNNTTSNSSNNNKSNIITTITTTDHANNHDDDHGDEVVFGSFKLEEVASAPHAILAQMVHHDGELFMFGGIISGNTANQECLFRRGRDGVWTPLKIKNGPQVRNAFCFVSARNRIWMYGGYGGAVRNEFYKYNPVRDSWKIVEANGDRPPAMYGAAMEAIGDQLYLFGGYDSQSVVQNRTYMFDINTRHWTNMNPSSPPEARFYHSHSVIDGKLYIYGGYDNADKKNDLSVYNPGTNQWTKVSCGGTSPPKMHAASMVALGDELYLYGGFDIDNKIRDEMWIFNTKNETWRTTVPTVNGKTMPRKWHTGATNGSQLFFYGGETTTQGYTNELLTFFHAWSLNEHHLMPRRFKRVVLLLFLMRMMPDCPWYIVPPELIYEIIQLMTL